MSNYQRLGPDKEKRKKTEYAPRLKPGNARIPTAKPLKPAHRLYRSRERAGSVANWGEPERAHIDRDNVPRARNNGMYVSMYHLPRVCRTLVPEIHVRPEMLRV